MSNNQTKQTMIVQYKDGRIHAYAPLDPNLALLWTELDQIQSVVYADVKSVDEADNSNQSSNRDFYHCIDEDYSLQAICRGMRGMSYQSQKQIANKMGLPQIDISRFELGKVTNPTTEFVTKYLECANCASHRIKDILDIYFGRS